MTEHDAFAALGRVLTGAPWPESLLQAYFLMTIRVTTVLAMTPVLQAIPMPLQARVLVVLGLSGAIAAGLPMQPVAPAGAGAFVAAACTEVALGATLALGVLLAFAAFSFAGNLLDVQIGFGMAQVFDPAQGRPSPVLASTFSLAGVLVFFLVEGHHALLRGIAFSLEQFPAGAAWPLATAADGVLRQAGGVFTLGFALAAPVVFCILLTELALGVVARNLPQVNMFVLGLPIKVMVGLAALTIWATGMGPAMQRVYGSIYTTWSALFPAPAAPAPPGVRR